MESIQRFPPDGRSRLCVSSSSSREDERRREEAEEDYQVPSSNLCLRQAAVCIPAPQRCVLVTGPAEVSVSPITTALLSRYVENSSSPPSVEDKQPQVLELGESSNTQYWT